MTEPETKDTSNTAAQAATAAASSAEEPNPAPQPKPADAAPDLAAQLAAAKAEAAANFDKFMRTAADLENFRRRTVREKEDLRTTATAFRKPSLHASYR